jgi:ParB family chromosome partitioning protein
MATATVEQVQTTFQMIELAKITPSPMNPRKRFDEKTLKELAESIKAHGVQQPIVVRPDGNKKERFEIVVGERRFRASKLAGMTDVPAIIRPLSNAAALEIMVIENLQREDVHPLDEALGYEALMKKSSDHEAEGLPGAPRHTSDSIAAKVGKSVGYVYARLKLLALVPAAREAFQENHITAGHAVLIARLQPREQLLAIFACFSHNLTQFDRDRIKKLDPAAAKLADVEEAFGDDPFEDEDGFHEFMPRLLPEKCLRDWIQENVNLKLKGVAWDLDDMGLVPGAGACSTCPKRSVSNPALFAELTKKGEDDTCFDPECFKAKQSAFVKLQTKIDKQDGVLVKISEQTAYTKPKEGETVLKKGQWVEAKAGSCDSTAKALIVRGEEAGAHKVVCTDVNCKVHKRHLQAAPTSFRPETDPATRAKRDAEAEIKRQIENQLVVNVLKAAIAQFKKPDAKTIAMLAELARDSFYGMEETTLAVMDLKSQKELDALYKKANFQQAMGLLFLAILGDNDWLDAPVMKLAIKLGKVDVAKMRGELEKKAKAEQRAPEPAKSEKTATKKGKASKKAKAK